MRNLLLGLIVFAQLSAAAQYSFYKKGTEAYQAGNYKEAIDQLATFLSKSGRQQSLDAEAYYIKGLSHYKLKKWEDAATDFSEAIRLNHSNKGNIYWFKAKCYSEEGYASKAIAEYSEAMRILTKPKEQVSLLLERSFQYKKINDDASALGDLNAALLLAPDNEEIKKELSAYKSTAKVLPPPPTDNTPRELSTPTATAGLREMYKGEKRYALVIGNSTYKHVAALKNPVNDASEIAKTLQGMNFEVISLTDATYGEMRNSFMKFHEKLVNGPKDQTVGLFYYAGHGVQNDGENYLIPVDANLEYEDDIQRQCFPVQKIVLGNMERSNSRMNILILDACRNNPFPATSRDAGGGLTEMRKAKGSFIAYATAPGSTASDGTGKNGLYTQELLKAMKKPGLTLEQVFKDVRFNVLKLSGDKQNTWDNSNITGEFYFNFGQ